MAEPAHEPAGESPREPGLEIRAVAGIGDVRHGDDLAALIVAAAPWLAGGDVLVVTSKIVSKAEGRTVAVPSSGPERDAARGALLAAETAREVASRGLTRIVATRHGFVLASAGIDASKVDSSRLVLLPVDPDASARRLRAELRERFGLHVAVVITDTMGRPWRVGLTDVAIGAAGIEALRDYRGETDAYGNELQVTQMAVIDELAAAGELVKGKYDQVPVAVIRGLGAVSTVDGAGALALVRDVTQDLFSLGTAEARVLGLRDAAALADASAFRDAPVDTATVERALAAAGTTAVRVADETARDKLRSAVPGMPDQTAEIVVPYAIRLDPMTLALTGASVHRLRTALAADGIGSAWLDADPATVAEIVQLTGSPLGVLALGLTAR
jgi:coenzyme F420-0:L-glutamate ligase/coenzyme F420-1:gamma-L-glutamate ligase